MKRENEFILELCKFIEPNKGKIESLMEHSLHWPYILGQILFNRMGGAAYYTLRECGLLGKVNREFRNTLKTIYDSAVVKSESLIISLDSLSSLLQAAGFPYALLKGAYLVSLYPKGLRTSNDLDILVHQRDLSKLEIILKDGGFEQGHIRSGTFTPATRAEILSSRMNRGETVPFIKRVKLPQMEYLEIDINFSLDFKARQESEVISSLLNNTEPLIHTASGDLVTLSAVDFLIHLCCHLYKEATVYAWVEMERDLSLYKFADIYLLLYKWADANLYRELESHIREYGLQKENYYALLRTKELFNVINGALNALIEAIRPQNTAYLNEILRPDQKKTYRYTAAFTDWLFESGRKERLYENANAGA